MKNGESIKFPWYLPTVQLLKAEAILKKIVYYFFSYLPPIFTYKMKKVNALEKTLILGKTEEKEVRENEMIGWRH